MKEGPMAKPRRAKPQPRSLEDAWAEAAKLEKDVIGTATRAAERMPAPVDVVDSSLLFAAKILRGQRDALVPLLQGVGPKTRKGEPALTPAAEAVKAAFDLAESVVETQRKVLRGLVETVTPPLARHAEGRARAATASGPRTTARRTPVGPARKTAS
jgi:hypothetical protein